MGRNEIDELEAAQFPSDDPTRSVSEYRGRLPAELRDGYYRAETLRGRELLIVGVIWIAAAAGIFFLVAKTVGW